MAEIIQINNNTWRIEDDGVRFFLLTGDESALMIDSGMNTPNAKEIVESITNLPITLLNTHCDIDHISGNNAFEEFYISENEIDYYLKMNKQTNTIKFVKDKEIIDLGNRKLQIINLPGHTPGSIAILDINNRVLIGGDSIQDGRIFMFGEIRNLNAFIISLQELWNNYQNEFDVVYPSHGSIPINKDIIPKIIEAAKQIKENKVQGERIEMMSKEITYYDFGYVGFLCD